MLHYLLLRTRLCPLEGHQGSQKVLGPPTVLFPRSFGGRPPWLGQPDVEEGPWAPQSLSSGLGSLAISLVGKPGGPQGCQGPGPRLPSRPARVQESLLALLPPPPWAAQGGGAAFCPPGPLESYLALQPGSTYPKGVVVHLLPPFPCPKHSGGSSRALPRRSRGHRTGHLCSWSLGHSLRSVSSL